LTLVRMTNAQKLI